MTETKRTTCNACKTPDMECRYATPTKYSKNGWLCDYCWRGFSSGEAAIKNQLDRIEAALDRIEAALADLTNFTEKAEIPKP